MAKTSKYGEVDESTCPACGKPIKPKWVACPECGVRLKAGAPNASTLNPNRFVCPGCGGKAAAAEGGTLCPKCDAFVHRQCLRFGAEKGRNTDGDLCREYLCPICKGIVCIAPRNYHTLRKG